MSCRSSQFSYIYSTLFPTPDFRQLTPDQQLLYSCIAMASMTDPRNSDVYYHSPERAAAASPKSPPSTP